jgi:transglutaminase-like putative cysteine protease
MSGARKPERRRETAAESTGQLLWLVAAVLVAVLPHLPHVHPWVPLMVFSIAGWRVYSAWRRRGLPSAWVRVPLTLLGFVGILLTYRQVSGLDAGSGLLMVMVAMKLLETRGHRDRAVVVFICLFLLFAAFLREQALWGPAYLLGAVLVAITALLQISRSSSPVRPGHALTTAARLLLQAVPLMAILFLLFPRVPGPFWSLPQRSSTGMSGLTDSMSPGDISELALSDKVAFRVRFDGDIPRGSDLYWRGPVLNRFDGRRWERRSSGYLPKLREQIDPQATTVDYEMTLEPSNARWLLALETPVNWSAEPAALNSNFELLSFTPLDRRTSYRARAGLGGATPGSMTERAWQADTSLPVGSNPRSVAFAQQLYADAGDDREFLARILRTFREQPFYYSLTPALLGAESVDEFLFSTREGFCGHYASAFAVLARAAGLPARIVTGYQGGELNPLGNYWLVRQADAHAWVEVWLDDRWQRFDPTAAVAPERIEWGMDAAIDSGSLAGAETLRSSRLVDQMMMSWDAVNAAWNRWVLAFGPDSQAGLLKLAGLPESATRYLVGIMAAMTAACMFALAWYQQRLYRPRRNRLGRAYRVLCQRTAKVTRPRRAEEGPLEYARRAAELRPDLAAELDLLFDTYARLRYDEQADESAERAFADAVRRFRPRRHLPAPA